MTDHSNFLHWINTTPKTGAETYHPPQTTKVLGANVAYLRIHKNYNGSGPSAFGGAKEWPHITLTVALPADTSNSDGQKLLDNMRLMLRENGYQLE